MVKWGMRKYINTCRKSAQLNGQKITQVLSSSCCTPYTHLLPALSHMPTLIKVYLFLLSITWITSDANNLGFLIPMCFKITCLHKWNLGKQNYCCWSSMLKLFDPSVGIKSMSLHETFSALCWDLIWEFLMFIIY